ncbi:MAG TPA: hypothetical protein PKC14_01755 [Candidatus Absconditabacterales bacterium]|nr:hypothetical protein [Candidatus Absconditabacterales bacterium]
MKGIVDHVQRVAKMRAHTATHLLHAHLTQIFPDTKQAGSLVDQDYLRFDFQAPRALSEAEVVMIEQHINSEIQNALPVIIKEMSYQEAIGTGAKAFFEDKYGDVVRVVSILDSGQEKKLSVELCGGTHVSNTSEIGAFVVVDQEAVASGTRRISAYTGPKVGLYAMDQVKKLHEIAVVLDCTPKQISEKLEKNQKEYTQLQQQFQSLQDQILVTKISSFAEKSKKTADIEMVIDISDDSFLMSLPLKQIADLARQHYSTQTLGFFASTGNYLISCPAGSSAKELQKKLGLQGGGHDQMVQGKDSSFKEKLGL